MFVYCIENKINGKKYIGQTKKPVKYRINEHLKKVNGMSSLPIHCAIRKHGINNFETTILEECETKEELNEREIYWIITLNTLCPNGYNIRSGGIDSQPPNLGELISYGLKHLRKKVLQFNPVTGIIIKEFESLGSASNELSIDKANIGKCTKNFRVHTMKGFGFIYKDDYEKLVDKTLIIPNWSPKGKRKKKVFGIDKNGDIVEFEGLQAAAKFANVCTGSIQTSIRKGTFCSNRKWYYKKEG